MAAKRGGKFGNGSDAADLCEAPPPEITGDNNFDFLCFSPASIFIFVDWVASCWELRLNYKVEEPKAERRKMERKDVSAYLIFSTLSCSLAAIKRRAHRKLRKRSFTETLSN